VAQITEQLLAQYYDGELSEKQNKRIEALLKENPEMQTQLAHLDRVSDFVRMADEQATKSISFDGFKERVLNELKTEKKAAVVERVTTWTKEFFEHRTVLWAPLAAVGTVAVVLILAMPMFLSQPQGTEIQGAPQGDMLWLASQKTVTSASVLKVQFESGEYEVFLLAGEHGGTSPVVWLKENPL